MHKLLLKQFASYWVSALQAMQTLFTDILMKTNTRLISWTYSASVEKTLITHLIWAHSETTDWPLLWKHWLFSIWRWKPPQLNCVVGWMLYTCHIYLYQWQSTLCNNEQSYMQYPFLLTIILSCVAFMLPSKEELLLYRHICRSKIPAQSQMISQNLVHVLWWMLYAWDYKGLCGEGGWDRTALHSLCRGSH